jgi:O6-methylguanine-DNA--protein-cysteine methyltransferase
VTRYNLIALIAIIAMPAAAAGNFGLAAYEAMTGRAPAWFAVLIGLATAVGLEATGVLLGHTATGYWQRKDLARFAVSALGMALYVGFGTWEMSAIPFGRVVPALAALAYFAAAMQSDLHTAVVGDATKSDLRTAFDLEQARLDRETTRLLRVERERAKLVAATVDEQPAAQPLPVAQVAQVLTPAQQRVYDAIKAQPNATYSDVAAQLGVSRQYVGKVAAQLNGQLKEMNQ